MDDELVLGRSQAGDGALGGDASLSTMHARVSRAASGGWEISDLGSEGGTFLNGKSLSGSVDLHRGDMLRMGSSKLLVLQGRPRPPVTAAPAVPRPRPRPAVPSVPAGAPSEPAAEPPPQPPAHRIAPLRRRWRAAVIDNVLLLPLAYGLSHVFGGALIAVAAALALTLIYDYLCESLRGQTIGKRASKIRVVRRDGSPLRPQHCAARNVLRFIDTIPGVPLVGLLSMTASGKERRQRLGDLAAGTVVVESEPRQAKLPADRRDRLVLAAYPFAWVAPVVALALLSPAALTRPCGKAMPTGDGKCLFRSVDGHLASAVYAQSGHTLRWNGFAIRALGATAVKLNARQYIEGVELAVTNRGHAPASFDSSAVRVGLEGQMNGVPVPVVGLSDNAPVRNFPSFSGDRPIAPGETSFGWVRFVIPSTAPPTFDPGSAFMVFGAPLQMHGDFGLLRL